MCYNDINIVDSKLSNVSTGDEGLRFLILTTLSTKPRVDKDLTFSGYFDVDNLNVETSKNIKVNFYTTP